MFKFLPAKYLSRRFLLTVLGALGVVVNAMLEVDGKPPIPQETINILAGLLASFILGESYRDGQAAKKE